jgi:porphobilinogen synthase
MKPANSTPPPAYPAARPRRLRLNPALRSMVRETRLSPQDFIYPLFVRHGRKIQEEIPSMPGQYKWSVDLLPEQARTVAGLGIPAVILFGIPAEKDPVGLENFSPSGIIQQAIQSIKDTVPELVVVSDICLCEYTDHGHCGLLNSGPGADPHLPEGYVLNDPTLDVLGKVAVSHADAGADILAPSGMMDGMVASIRRALDENGFDHLPILSYAVKYASSFYGPFRDAAEGAPKFGDRKSHQMDPANVREALREVALDVAEGADMLMVKPAMPYLDVIRRVHEAFPELPMAAYQVSGEYAMLKAAALNGWMDERGTVLESLTAIKRAGAGMMITYYAKEAARWLDETNLPARVNLPAFEGAR